MKKLIATITLGAGVLLAAPAVAGASSPYPPSTDDPGVVAPVPEDLVSGGALASAAGPELPTTGSDNTMLVQVGAVTLGLGVALAGGATLRRRRHAHA